MAALFSFGALFRLALRFFVIFGQTNVSIPSTPHKLIVGLAIRGAKYAATTRQSTIVPLMGLDRQSRRTNVFPDRKTKHTGTEHGATNRELLLGA